MMRMPEKPLIGKFFFIISCIVILASIGTGLVIVVLKPTESIPMSMTAEPDKHRQAREQIKIKEFHEAWGTEHLEWYLVRIMPSSEPLDQLTCMYFLIFPGRGWEGDVQGIMEIYNREEDKWSEPETIKKMVCEYTRLTWSEQQIRLSDGRIFEMPRVTADEETAKGYATFRVNVE